MARHRRTHPPSRRRSRRAQWGALVVASVALALCAVAYLASSGSGTADGPAPVAGSPATTPTVRPTVAATPVAAAAPRLTGGRVVVPRLGVSAPVDAVTSPDGVLGVPTDPSRVGWWNASAVPGSGRGSVIVDGHVNYRGKPGALSIVPKLRSGDRVSVSLPHSARTVDYAVREVRNYAKHGGLPNKIFDQQGPERLVLITCGGTFDSSTGNYESNVIAFAYPTGSA